MAENLKRQPKKGILKNSSSFESNERQKDQKAGTKWDEMNILATLHPADKDYGHMKIEEPKTPFNYDKEASASGDELDGLDAALLANRMEAGSGNLPRAMVTPPPIEEDSEEDISPEEMEIRKNFEVKRKKHYNEFQAVKLARKLMEQDSSEEDTEGEVKEEEGDGEKSEPSNTTEKVEGDGEEQVAGESMEADGGEASSSDKSEEAMSADNSS